MAFDQLDLVKAGALEFYEPDTKVFRALALAMSDWETTPPGCGKLP